MVGNDTEIAYDMVCRDVAILIQGHEFNLDLYVMALGGTNLVQGVAWLKLLGPFTTDYSLLTMSFVYHRQPITIQDDINSGPSEITPGQVKRLMSTQRVATLFQLLPTTPLFHHHYVASLPNTPTCSRHLPIYLHLILQTIPFTLNQIQNSSMSTIPLPLLPEAGNQTTS